MARAAMPAPRLTQEEADKIAAVVDAEAVAPAEQPPPASATPAPRNAAPRPKHRGTAVAKVVAADAVTATAPRPGLMDRAGRVLKIATVSLALFGLGLGAVWAALTLPHRANHAQPTVAERADPGSNGATLAAGAAPPSVEPGPGSCWRRSYGRPASSQPP